MLTENKFSKYLLYAVGEIFLVVIGILIALNINNWNTDQQLRKEEVKYLQKLKVDLQADLQNLDAFIIARNEKVSSALALLEMPMPDNEEAEFKLDNLINSLFHWKEYAPRTNTLQELTSSAKLSILQNDSIKTLLLDIEAKNLLESTGNEHMKREFHKYLYDRHTVLRELSPTMDTRATTIAMRPVRNTLITPEQLLILNKQSEAFLTDLTVRNGLKLAALNNAHLAGMYKILILETERLIGFIDEDLKEK